MVVVLSVVLCIGGRVGGEAWKGSWLVVVTMRGLEGGLDSCDYWRCCCFFIVLVSASSGLAEDRPI